MQGLRSFLASSGGIPAAKRTAALGTPAPRARRAIRHVRTASSSSRDGMAHALLASRSRVSHSLASGSSRTSRNSAEFSGRPYEASGAFTPSRSVLLLGYRYAASSSCSFRAFPAFARPTCRRRGDDGARADGFQHLRQSWGGWRQARKKLSCPVVFNRALPSRVHRAPLSPLSRTLRAKIGFLWLGTVPLPIVSSRGVGAKYCRRGGWAFLFTRRQLFGGGWGLSLRFDGSYPLWDTRHSKGARRRWNLPIDERQIVRAAPRPA